MGKKRKAHHQNRVDEEHPIVGDEQRQQRNRQMWGSGSGSSGSSSRRKTSSSSRGGSCGFSSSRLSNGVNETAIAKMFASIADEDDPNVASMEGRLFFLETCPFNLSTLCSSQLTIQQTGICKLCEDLGIDPMEDVRVLVLLWKLGANDKPAQISREEWCRGCAMLQVDSIAKLKSLLPSLDPGFLVDSEFKDFYKFTFQFNREGTHRTLDKDLVIALIQMVLTDRVDSERLSTFCEFLEQLKGDAYSRVTLDQWTSFFDFCLECKDLSMHDEETSAWPVLIDEYVEYMKRKL